MKLPEDFNKVTLTQTYGDDFFPPIGFLEIEEGNDGAGDNYGMYWELGKENQEPIICFKDHETFSLDPVLPNLSSFLAWYEETQGEGSTGLDLNDTTFFMNLFLKAKVLTKNGKHEEAIKRLELAVDLFGEYSDCWTLLAENYVIMNEKEKAEKAILHAVVSNYMFHIPSKKAFDLFCQIDDSGAFRENPLIKLREGLFSGLGDYKTPLTVDYHKLSEVIARFKEKKDFRSALLMEQNYGYLLSLKLREEQDKYHFNTQAWVAYFKKELLSIYPERVFNP